MSLESRGLERPTPKEMEHLQIILEIIHKYSCVRKYISRGFRKCVVRLRGGSVTKTHLMLE